VNLFPFRAHYDVSHLRQSIIAWLVLGMPAVTIGLCGAFWFGVLAWEYIHNPDRHLYEVAIMTPAMSVVTFIVASIAQIVAYIVLPFYVWVLLRILGRVPLLLLIAVTPLLGLMVWVGYERFVPDLSLYTDEMPTYAYGLTLARFVYGWTFELIVMLLYWWPLRRLQLNPAAAPAGS
jgi:hypothetical protein